MTDGTPALSILICDRRVPATAGTRSIAALTLEAMGHRVAMGADGPIDDLASYDVLLLWGTPGYFPRLRRQLRKAPSGARPLVAVLHAEPLPPPKASGLPRWSPLNAAEIAKVLIRDWRATDIYTNAFTLRRMMREGTIDLLFPMSLEKLEYLQEQGYEAWHIPYGYHARQGRLLGLDRDIDVLFLGDRRPRRRRRALAHLAAAGLEVTVRGSWHDPGLWGDRRIELLNRTKVVVHLQRYPGKLAAQRFFLAMANGALVVSEPIYKPAPFVPGEHFLMTPLEQMPAALRYVLEHPAERERIAGAAHRLIIRELTFEASMRAMMDVIVSRLSGRRARAR